MQGKVISCQTLHVRNRERCKKIENKVTYPTDEPLPQRRGIEQYFTVEYNFRSQM